MSALEIRHYRPEDRPACVRLRPWSSFGAEQTAAVWSWRYDGEGVLGRNAVCAVDEGEIVGLIGLTSFRLWHRGAGGPAVMITAAATAPEQRGQGLFHRLLEFLLDELANRADFVFAFPPAPLLAPLHSHHGFADLLEMPTLRLDGTRFRDFAPPPEGTVEPGQGFDARFDGLWNRVREHVGAAVVRNRRWLDWRVGQHPTRSYALHILPRDEHTLAGYAIVGSRTTRGCVTHAIIDLLADDEAAANLLLRGVVAGAIRQNAAAIETMLPLFHPSRRLLERRGFLPEAPLARLVGRGTRPDCDATTLRLAGWHLAPLDLPEA